MLTRWEPGWSELDEMFTAMSQLRSYMDRVFDEGAIGRGWEGRALPAFGGGWPRTNLTDAGQKLMLTAEVPGLTEKDIKLTLTQDVLTLSGERKTEVPQGYSIHRQERPTVQFSRSFELPCKVDAERAAASVKNGILTVTLEKATEALPREISVKGQ